MPGRLNCINESPVHLFHGFSSELRDNKIALPGVLAWEAHLPNGTLITPAGWQNDQDPDQAREPRLFTPRNIFGTIFDKHR